MVSFPVAEVTALTLGDGVLETGYAYSPKITNYQTVVLNSPADVSAGLGTSRGFWVYAQKDSQIDDQGWENSGARARNELTLDRGWNLVGYPYEQTQAFSGIQVKAPGAASPLRGLPGSVGDTVPPPSQDILLYRFGFVYGGASYESQDLSVPTGTLQVGRAMWVYVHQEGTLLCYGSPTPSPAGNGIAAGGSHSLWVRPDGTVSAWGYNGSGQLGDGASDYDPHPTPVRVQGLTDVVAVAGGDDHSLAVKRDGTVWTWGDNGCGQLGDGTTTGRLSPVLVQGLTNVVAVAGGWAHSLTLKGDGAVWAWWAWGDNGFDQLGVGDSPEESTPVRVLVRVLLPAS